MTANCSSSAPQRRAFALSLSNICGRLAALGLRPARDRCCATLDATTRDDLRNTALPAATSDAGLNCGICWGLTFDMRGGRKQAKPDCGRPLDGRVSHLAPVAPFAARPAARLDVWSRAKRKLE